MRLGGVDGGWSSFKGGVSTCLCGVFFVPVGQSCLVLHTSPAGVDCEYADI